jgi:lipopolysaccharide transport protein LptA
MRVSFAYLSIILMTSAIPLAAGGLIEPLPALAQAGAPRAASAASPGTRRVENPAAPAHSAGESSGGKATDKQTDSPFGAFGNSKNRGPVNIESDSMALDYKNNAVLFSGKVHAVQNDGTLTSNTLHVKYGKDFHEVQEMVADGGVYLSQGLRWCTADHGVMNQASHTVVLTGSPICHDQNDQISGTKITVHTDTGKSDVDGRVKAIIFPHDNKNGDNGKSSDNGVSSAQAKADN